MGSVPRQMQKALVWWKRQFRQQRGGIASPNEPAWLTGEQKMGQKASILPWLGVLAIVPSVREKHGAHDFGEKAGLLSWPGTWRSE